MNALLGALRAASLAILAISIPNTRTPVANLSLPGFEHVEVLRIDQDFHPNGDYEIAVDAWVTPGNTVGEVRMWWTDTAREGERSPFGNGVRKHITIDYERRESTCWLVHIRQGRSKHFALDVQLGEGGTIGAFGDVLEDDGSTVHHCRVIAGRLVSRKLLGLPIGLRALEVVCADPQGVRHRGELIEGD